MKIQKIQLKHFRNYSNLEISLGKGINIFYKLTLSKQFCKISRLTRILVSQFSGITLE